MIVRELVTRLGFNLDRSQLNAAERGLDNLKSSADRTASAFRSLAGALVAGLSIKSIIHIGDEMQSLRARIGQLPQTVGDVAASFDIVAARASNAKQDIGAYSTFYVKAGNATQDFVKDQETLLKIVDGAAFGLAASGATAVAQKQAFFQLGQAIGSPVVQMEEMNTVIDVAPDLFRELGKAIPGAEGNLKKFVGTGKVTGKMLAEGLVKAAAVFEKKIKEIPLTVGTAMVLVGNRFSLMIDRMNRSSKFITKIADFLISGFADIEAGVEKIIKAFDGWENAIRYVGIALGLVLGAKTLAMLAAFGLAGLRAMGVWSLIAIGVAAVATAVEDLYVWIQGGDSLTGKLIGPWEQWKVYVIGAVELLKDTFSAFWVVLKGYGQIWQGIFEINSDKILSGLKMLSDGALSIFKFLGKSIYDIFFSSIVNAISNAWDSVKTSVGSFFYGLKDAIGPLGSVKNPQNSMAGVLAAPQVSTAQMAPNSLTSGGPNISNNTNVTVTVPAGTTDQQVNFLKSSAQKVFSAQSDSKLARDMSTYAP